MNEGKTILEAWSGACTKHAIPDRWVVLCHENAKDDTIADWNAGTLKPIAPSSSKVFMFNKANPGGTLVVPTPDPFEVFWSKGTAKISVANRNDPANRIANKDTVSITVKPPSTAVFPTGTTITITLIYIRVNYLQAINVNKMFIIKRQSGASAPTTAKLNSERPSSSPDDGDDSWILKVTGTPAEVTLDLECVDLDLSKHGQHNVPYWLRVKVESPSSLPVKFDFTRNGSILLK